MVTVSWTTKFKFCRRSLTGDGPAAQAQPFRQQSQLPDSHTSWLDLLHEQ